MNLTSVIFPGARAAIYGALAGLLIGAYGMHRIHSNLDVAADNRAHEQVITHLVKRNVELRKFEEKYLAEQRKRRSAESAIAKAAAKLPVTQCDSEHLPLATVRLLNESRDPGSTEDSVRRATSLPAAEAGSPTAVTRGDLVLSDIDISQRYKEVASRCTALIDFVEAQQKSLHGK